MTAKDSLLIQINKDYVPTSIIGEGGKIAKKEKAKRDYAKNVDREQRLKMIEKKGVKTRVLPREGDSICDFETTINGDILFAFDSFELTPAATEIIDQLTEVIDDIPTKVEIIGHTDDQGEEDYNMNLSQLRAMAVGNRMRENGIINITEIGKGESEPIASNKTDEGRKKNRRVEIRMYSEE